jgi:polyisoprenoid-binding protein YceI
MSFSPPATTPSVPSPLPTTGTWSLDPHSTVTFAVVHHQVATFRSSFVNLDGDYDGASQTITGRVAASDVTVPHEALVKHLLSPDFFDAETYPRFSFVSTKIIKDGEVLAIDGDLTLRGVTQPVTGLGIYHPQRTVRAGNGVTNERFGIDLSAAIDRRAFGISFNNFIADGVVNLGWLVRVEAALEFVENVDQ